VTNKIQRCPKITLLITKTNAIYQRKKELYPANIYSTQELSMPFLQRIRRRRLYPFYPYSSREGTNQNARILALPWKSSG
jgi:hypothetical protein